MNKQKRSYIPKIKGKLRVLFAYRDQGLICATTGCWECAKRRIDCDRTFPTCLKCAWKGISCSSNGRFRFIENARAPTKRRRQFAPHTNQTSDGSDSHCLGDYPRDVDRSDDRYTFHYFDSSATPVVEVATGHYSFTSSPIHSKNFSAFPDLIGNCTIPLLITYCESSLSSHHSAHANKRSL